MAGDPAAKNAPAPEPLHETIVEETIEPAEEETAETTQEVKTKKPNFIEKWFEKLKQFLDNDLD